LIEQRNDGVYTGEGRLTIVKGKYLLPGGNGVVSRGHLFYPPGTLLNNPVLDIRVAQKKASQFGKSEDLGIYVQGTLLKPTYNLFSSNHLGNSEIMNKMGLGSSETSGNNNNNNQLLSQTALLVGGGANPLVENIQNRLGLEEFGVQTQEKYFSTQEGNDTMLVVGKSLTDRVYVQFIQGMLMPFSALRIKYFLSKYFAVGAETSTEGQGVDLYFSKEQKIKGNSNGND
jgi:translocation and assembly module TamB